MRTNTDSHINNSIQPIRKQTSAYSEWLKGIHKARKQQVKATICKQTK